jgi:hypothetical protein
MDVKAFDFVPVIEKLQFVGEKAETKVNCLIVVIFFSDSGVRNTMLCRNYVDVHYLHQLRGHVSNILTDDQGIFLGRTCWKNCDFLLGVKADPAIHREKN